MDGGQLAILDNKLEADVLSSKGTVTIHPFPTDNEARIKAGSKGPHHQTFCLKDNSNVRVCALMHHNDPFKIYFETDVPKDNQYDISLYFITSMYTLRHIRTLHSNHINRNQFYEFGNIVPYPDKTAIYNDSYLFCTMITRKDIPYVFSNKDMIPCDTTITDCSLLFEKDDLSDFTIVVGEKEFRVHKQILASKSPVFLAMFVQDMKEKNESKVTLKDVEEDVLQEMLRYIYTNTVQDLDVHAEKLLALADKYDLPKLKVLCAKRLCDFLTKENAVDTLVLADKHNCSVLKENTITFIKQDPKPILLTAGYEKLLESSETHLLHDIVEGLSNLL